MIEDITDRKQAEAALREAHEEMEKRVVERTESLKQNEDKLRKLLHDKDVLLKEINHRVKNNLQVISSIIRLQSKFTEQCESKTLLKSILNRVTAIAHVHKMLYATGSLSEINIKDYVNTLIHYLSVSYSCSSKIKMRVDVDNVELNTETIIPCGLLINELVSNSINHAFPDNSEGVINISLKKVDDVRLLLSIADNGIGLPDNVDFRDNIRTLGLQLISTMAEGQLNGNIEFVNHKGTRIDVYFRELNYNQRV
ncbi:MAG: hypothetical protein GWO10_29255 [candidate division Zixibacteria bacterium]|nr:hypothetical protein [candidate division Zixibacteria bacterium]NIR67761.1 hypothetical protein [candidate division Zixibacteria bacterium]NIX59521.1 hypothetical protein [candidate division Zixibacteria bacterium]